MAYVQHVDAPPTVPALKIPGSARTPLNDDHQTPRSMVATERAIADIAAASAETEEEAAMLTARKEHAQLVAADQSLHVWFGPADYRRKYSPVSEVS